MWGILVMKTWTLIQALANCDTVIVHWLHGSLLCFRIEFIPYQGLSSCSNVLCICAIHELCCSQCGKILKVMILTNDRILLSTTMVCELFFMFIVAIWHVHCKSRWVCEKSNLRCHCDHSFWAVTRGNLNSCLLLCQVYNVLGNSKSSVWPSLVCIISSPNEDETKLDSNLKNECKI
jgi:hypothetical protein